MAVKFNKWAVSESDLSGLDCNKAKDLIVKCFYEAQKESVARGKEELGFNSDDDAIKQSVNTAIQMVFEQIGADFENPDKNNLLEAVQVLAKKASSWGTPSDIIEYHKGQMGKIFSRLE